MIKVGYCVAYDWRMLQNSIPPVYNQADIICLSIDRNRQSWTGESFSWDEDAFQMLISELDPLKKIKIYEDAFYNPDLLPMQNEVNQRNKIAAFMGEGGWHIQLDTDEYFTDFPGFVNYLKEYKSNRKVNICCPLINLYKITAGGILWIKPNSFSQVEYIQIATQYPDYEYGRRNGNFNILTKFPILHQSWARSENEIWEKLKNWGHAKDFDIKRYFLQWKQVDSTNYTSYKNFHHLYPETWPALELKRTDDKVDLFSSVDKGDFLLPITNWNLAKANSIWLSRINKLFRYFSR
ncbi:MAG: hypothetical protein COW65_05215 [Cytophagales bacterium CG18_big_fil_WC_8_21_14_2_50_42_9]|nr:MAG: hypothetical protein COW65_05215 [Cytophagales bacterium CG18_big_fil_WC_8_21_14_2_50_42_9]